MRLFAGDVVPGLALIASSIPDPWILPNASSRLHRSRLVNLLASALRGADPTLRLIKLRWIERDLVASGKLNLPPNCMVWWRIKESIPPDPEQVVRGAWALHTGLNVFDFSSPIHQERLGWISAFKMLILPKIIDNLVAARPFDDVEPAIDVIQDSTATLQSPLDLLDFSDRLIERIVLGDALASARSRAMAHVITKRLALDTPEQANAAARAVIAVFGGEALGEAEKATLAQLGLMDVGAPRPLPLGLALREPEIARHCLIAIASAQRLDPPLATIAPPQLLEDVLGSATEGELPQRVFLLSALSSPHTPLEHKRPFELRRADEAELVRAVREKIPVRGDVGAKVQAVIEEISEEVIEGRGDTSDPRAQINRGVQLVESLVRNPAEAARGFLELAEAALGAGKNQELGRLLERVRQTIGEDGDTIQHAHLWRLLGTHETQRGDSRAARRSLDRAFELYKARDDAAGLAATTLWRGHLDGLVGEPESAERAFSAALERYRALDDAVGEARARLARSHVRALLSNEQGVMEDIAGTLELCARHNLTDERVLALIWRSEVQLRNADYSGASAELATAWALAESSNAAHHQAHIELRRSALCFAVGDDEGAMDAIDTAESLYTQIDDAVGIALSIGRRAQLLESMGEDALAVSAYERLLSWLAERDHPLLAGHAHWRLGALCLRTGDHRRAQAELAEARDVFARLGLERLADSVRRLLVA